VDGFAQAIDGGLHAEHKEGVMEIVERGDEEAVRGGGVGEAAADEHSGGERGDVESGGQAVGRFEVDGGD